MLMIWQMSTQWKVRPSEIVRIDDPVTAFHFDRAVLYFGQSYEADIHDATKDAKSEGQAERSASSVTDRWLRDEEEQQQAEVIKAPTKFRDPADELKRRRENGKL
jgi:hypothetical protein